MPLVHPIHLLSPMSKWLRHPKPFHSLDLGRSIHPIHLLILARKAFYLPARQRVPPGVERPDSTNTKHAESFWCNPPNDYNGRDCRLLCPFTESVSEEISDERTDSPETAIHGQRLRTGGGAWYPHFPLRAQRS